MADNEAGNVIEADRVVAELSRRWSHFSPRAHRSGTIFWIGRSHVMTTQPTSLKSTDVYRAAWEVIAPWSVEHGFVGPKDRRKRGPWVRTRDGVTLEFDLQVDQYGWTPNAGGKLTVNFEAEFPSGRHHSRFSGLLARPRSAEEWAKIERTDLPRYNELDQAHFAAIASRVRRKLPEAPDQRDLALGASGGDPWLIYWDTEDVTSWMRDFIVPRLPRMLE